MQTAMKWMIACGLLLCTVGIAQAEEYELTWFTIDGGGGMDSQGDGYSVSGTIGQPDAGVEMTGGGYSVVGGFWVVGNQAPGKPIEIVSTHSCLLHDDGGPNEIELCIDLLAKDNPVEPRVGGPDMLRFGFSADLDSNTVATENVQIMCAGDPAGTFNVALDGTDAIIVSLDAALTDLNCCNVAFEGLLSTDGGPVNGGGSVIAVAGDMNFSTGVSGADPSLIKPHFGEIAGVDLSEPQWDYDRNGGVTGGDFSVIKPLLNRVAQACP